MSRIQQPRRLRAMLGALVLATALPLAACNDAALDLAAKPRASGGGVTVAVDGLEGAPDAVRARLAAALVGAAEARQVVLVAPGDRPRFRVRGYVSAHAGADGRAMVAYVFDVFDSRFQRTQRVTGEAQTRLAASDPWSVIDDAVLGRVAAQGMDGIASVVGGGGTAVAGGVRTAPLSFAPLE